MRPRIGGRPHDGSAHMKRIGIVVAFAAALALAFPAEAQVALDLKLGYALPTGDVIEFGGSDFYGPMKNTWSGAIPIEVAQSSGYDFLDQLGLEAFRKAQPFHNPPAALVGVQGEFQFYFTFVMTTGPRP